MQQLRIAAFILFLSFPFYLSAQTGKPVYFKGAIKENKEALSKRIVQNTISNNLLLPLNTATEEAWVDAFWGMELLRYKSPSADGSITIAWENIAIRSIFFQRALLELSFANYPGRFITKAKNLLTTTTDAKIFAMCAKYLLQSRQVISPGSITAKKQQLIKNEKDEAIIDQLLHRVTTFTKHGVFAAVTDITNTNFLPGATIVYSFQRRNRNYTGLALVRNSTGKFMMDESSKIFSVPQLARSINNLPGYLTNGNTPQGIFRMYGFDTSRSDFIGPTTNIQLTMPVETSTSHFFNDSISTDTLWTLPRYQALLPAHLKNCQPLLESFYAGKAGRTEIIAHGTTVNPEYYKGTSYYPQTPTMGCLCTLELWSEADGKRMLSDQQRLVAMVQKAGGPNGYVVVIEIDNAEKPVTLEDVLAVVDPSSIK